MWYTNWIQQLTYVIASKEQALPCAFACLPCALSALSALSACASELSFPRNASSLDVKCIWCVCCNGEYFPKHKSIIDGAPEWKTIFFRKTKAWDNFEAFYFLCILKRSQCTWLYLSMFIFPPSPEVACVRTYVWIFLAAIARIFPARSTHAFYSKKRSILRKLSVN